MPRRLAGLVLGMGGVLLLPLLAIAPPGSFTPSVAAAILGLGIVCSVLWGTLFLGEALSVHMVLGALVVTAGTVLVLRG